MKKLFFALCLLLGTLAASATTTDVNTSKGTDQLTIVSLSPVPGDERVSRHAAMEVAFNVPLDAKHIKEHDIKLTYLTSQTNEHIAGAITYANNTLTFKPENPLEPGVYEVTFRSLKTDSTTDALIYTITYRFVVVKELLQSIVILPESIELKEGDAIALRVTGHYDNGTQREITPQVLWGVSDARIAAVDANATLTGISEGATMLSAALDNITGTANVTVYKEINGYRLPPEPDPAVNNATLLGVDSNNNGVRDDVERLIIIEEAKNPNFPQTHTAISLQYAWAWQKMIENPILETRQHLEKASACQWYWFNKKTKNIRGYINRRKWRVEHSNILGVKLEDKIFNTKERIQQRFKFNKASSGNIFDIADQTIDACRINIDALGE